MSDGAIRDQHKRCRSSCGKLKAAATWLMSGDRGSGKAVPVQTQSNTRFAFRDLTLAEAEAEIVGAAIDHELALTTALLTLAIDDFRSELAPDLRRIFYVVAGWYAKGQWSAEINRPRLERYFPNVWIDGLWCPSGVVSEYVEALCAAVTESNRLADNALTATRAWWSENPLAASERPVAHRVIPRPVSGPRGGVG